MDNCLNCNEELQIKTKKFCSRQCSAVFQHKLKREQGLIRIYTCNCGELRDRKTQKCSKCSSKELLINKTKKEIISRYLTNERGFIQIRKHSRNIYNRSDKPKCCNICGYNNHYQVSHIKGISSFNDDALISEINHIDNLVALCPNHHWEYDNNLVEL